MPNLDMNRTLLGLKIQLFASEKPGLQTTGELEDKKSDPDNIKETFEIEPSGSQPKEVSKSTGFRSLKQEKIADVITGKSGDSIGGTPMVAQRGTTSYGGEAVNIAGDLSAGTSTTGETRGRTRFGKKLDPTSRAINDLGSEQVLVDVVGAKPLSQSKDEVQGYPGRKLNDRAVRTKTKGMHPAASSYQRSLDLIMREELLYPHGQVIKTSALGIDYQDIPTRSAVWNATTGRYEEVDAIHLGTRGNYVPKSLKFTIQPTGVVSDLEFITDDISVTTDNNTVLEAAAQHAKTHTNYIEAVRREMEIKSSDESLEGWSPLSRAIIQPKQTLSYMYDLESETGAHAYMANRFSKLSLSYLINRVGKDGTHMGKGIDEAFNSIFDGYRPSSSLSDDVNEMINDHAAKLNGSPAVFITAFDSPTKYNTKADILNQPRSLKMHLAIGNNHINGLKVKPEFIKFVEKNQVFSTMDHDYDGIHPVYMNSAYRLATATDWNKQFKVEGAQTNHDGKNAAAVGHTYAYSDDRNRYTSRVYHPLLAGVYDWIVEHAHALRKSVRAGETAVSFEIPIYYGLNTVSTWQLLVNAAMNHIQIARLEGLRDLMQYSEDHGYPFADLVSVDGKTTTQSDNFGFVAITEPIKVGKMNEVSKLSWVMPELFWPVDESDDGNMKVVLPWYMGEDMLDRVGNTFRLNEDFRVMNYPTFRSGNILDPMNIFMDQSERNVRLSLDMMVQPMSHSLKPGGVSIYKYDHTDSGIITIDENVSQHKDLFTLENFLKQPRELGLRVVLPRGYIIPDQVAGDLELNHNILRSPGYTAQYYYASSGKKDVNINTLQGENNEVMPVGSLYVQNWDFFFAGNDNIDTNGLVIGIPQVLSESNADPGGINLKDGTGIVQPFATYNEHGNVQTQPIHNNDFKIASLQQAFWARAQLLNFIVNPFDIYVGNRSLAEDAIKYDIFDFAYIFGFVGFRSSDYSEDQYLRSMKDIEEGFAYVKDRYIEDTPLLK